LTVLFLVIAFPAIVYRDTPIQQPGTAARLPEPTGDLEKLLQNQSEDVPGANAK